MPPQHGRHAPPPLVHRVQDRVARGLGLDPMRRGEVIAAMLAPKEGETAGYWLQLLMATTLATLGLALNSTAVVIGAMLIAPLMRPIVELAMGLATGSAPLVFRAGGRSVASIAVVIGASAAISWLLPFHEVTGELAARTAPSLLDLFVAAACALVGAYATMFAASDMASTAAGTSIGISLVPPLCTLGYGVSDGDHSMAIGAGLLFTANITGILMVASVAFLLVGFGQVGKEARAGSHTARDLATRLGKRWSEESWRLGAISRIVLPLLLFGAIFLPLRRAVGDMTRRSEIRQELRAILATGKAQVAQSAIEFDASGVVVRVVIVGDAGAARELDQKLRAMLVEHSEPKPRLSVWAVPDAQSLGALAARLDELPPPPAAPEPPAHLIDRPVAEIRAAVVASWPPAAGEALVAAWIEATSVLRIRIVHLGPPVGSAGMQILAKAVSPTEPVAIDEIALAPVVRPAGEAAQWVVPATELVERVQGHEGLWVCLSVPAEPKLDPRRPRWKPAEPPEIVLVRAIVKNELGAHPRVAVTEGTTWSAVAKLGSCAEAGLPPPVPTDPVPATP